MILILGLGRKLDSLEYYLKYGTGPDPDVTRRICLYHGRDDCIDMLEGKRIADERYND